MLISVVLPNYNGKDLLRRNLPSIFKALNQYPHEIIVVDDCSTDASIEVLEREFPTVVVLRHAHNKGFSETCNSGIFKAVGQYVCVANTDVEFDERYFQEVLAALSTGEFFAVKGRVVNHCSESGRVLNVDTTARLFQKRGLLRFDKTSLEGATKLGLGIDCYLVFLGCCFVADRHLLKTLGGFDTIYSPFYWEDADLPLRAMKSGLKIRYLDTAIVHHQLSSTIPAHHRKVWRKLISDRNKFMFSWRHMENQKQWLNHILFLGLGIAIRWIRFDYSYYLGFMWALFRYTTYRKLPVRLARPRLGL